MFYASHSLHFLLGQEPVNLDLSHHPSYGPSTTILNYLRSLPGYKGTKEGCAEGDCGACTVVVAYPENGRLKYLAINSCLVFLPWLHGKQLITVEHLCQGKELHFVQRLLVDMYGSQCGFCTPGIVMSLFALYKSNLPPTRENSVQALSGNLCRCTGYHPVLEAAMKVLEANEKDDAFSRSERDILEQLTPFQSQSLSFDTGKQVYYRPSLLNEVIEIRKEHPDAILFSGATDVALRQSKKSEFLPKLLDLSGIKELCSLEERESEWIIGSGVSIHNLWHFSSGKIPMFDELCSLFASNQIRNLATIGGNIGSASPIGDSLPVLTALKADVELTGSAGSRRMHMEEFIQGYRKTAIRPDEIIRSVVIPKPSPGILFRFIKASKRKDLDISTVSLAARVELDPGNRIADIMLAYGGMAEKPARAKQTESWLLGKPWDHSIIRSASVMLRNEFKPISDARSGKEARNILAGNLLLKFFIESGKPVADHE